jgi:hypothetical protein
MAFVVQTSALETKTRLSQESVDATIQILTPIKMALLTVMTDAHMIL